jgi:hypothetical protein
VPAETLLTIGPVARSARVSARTVRRWLEAKQIEPPFALVSDERDGVPVWTPEAAQEVAAFAARRERVRRAVRLEPAATPAFTSEGFPLSKARA